MPERSGEILRRQRRGLGLTVRGLAELLSVSPAYVSMLEAGSRKASPKLLERITEVLGSPAVASQARCELGAEILPLGGDAARNRCASFLARSWERLDPETVSMLEEIIVTRGF